MTDTPEYAPPKVWSWTKPNGGRFENINRPTAGATHEKELPVGRHPLQLYSLGTPNGVKVTIMLEELLALGHKGAEYDAWLIKIGDGDQFGSGFVAINPNSKIPALVDRSGPTPIRVFETGAILMYLAEKFGEFLPTEPAARAECLSWLFWQMGSTPYVGGGRLSKGIGTVAPKVRRPGSSVPFRIRWPALPRPCPCPGRHKAPRLQRISPHRPVFSARTGRPVFRGWRRNKRRGQTGRYPS